MINVIIHSILTALLEDFDLNTKLKSICLVCYLEVFHIQLHCTYWLCTILFSVSLFGSLLFLKSIKEGAKIPGRGKTLYLPQICLWPLSQTAKYILHKFSDFVLLQEFWQVKKQSISVKRANINAIMISGVLQT